MKKYISIHKVLLLIVAVLLISCEQERGDTLEETLKVENGVLFFKDESSFKNQLEILHAMTREEKESWLNEIGFKNSLYEMTKNMSLEEIVESKYIDVPDDVFSAILNSDGVYVIGNEAHKILQNEELIMNKNNLTVGTSNWNQKSVQRFEIFYGDNDYLKLMNSKRDVPYSVKPYNGAFVYPNNPLERANLGVTHLSAHLIGWNRGYVGYASFGIKIKGRKYKRRKWRDDDIRYASITYEAEVVGDFGTIRERSGFKSGTNEKDVQETIFWKTGGRYSQGFISADFEYEDDGYPRVRSDLSGYGFRF